MNTIHASDWRDMFARERARGAAEGNALLAQIRAAHTLNFPPPVPLETAGSPPYLVVGLDSVSRKATGEHTRTGGGDSTSQSKLAEFRDLRGQLE